MTFVGKNKVAMEKQLEVEEDEIANIETIQNDMTENILPAFEQVCSQKMIKNKVIVIIGDCCAHTHIGCEETPLPRIGPKDPENVRKAEVDRLYGCDKCKKQFVGADWVLKDEIEVQNHRRRWENVCSTLTNVPIIFVPVQ